MTFTTSTSVATPLVKVIFPGVLTENPDSVARTVQNLPS